MLDKILKKDTDKKETDIKTETRITVRGTEFGDTQTIVISPNGTNVRIIKGGF